jgi:hypothetical protein
VAAFQVVNKILERNPRTAKAGDSTHDFRIANNYMFGHISILNVPDAAKADVGG